MKATEQAQKAEAVLDAEAWEVALRLSHDEVWLKQYLKMSSARVVMEALAASKLSLRKFAKRVNLSSTYLSAVKCGHCRLSFTAFFKVKGWQ